MVTNNLILSKIFLFFTSQFEIVGATESEGKGFSNGLWDEKSKDAHSLVNNKKTYKRLFIHKK